MKKTLLIFLALALVSTFAFAEAMVGGEAAISGSVSLTAGYDLDNEGYGFVNDSDIQIVLPFLGGDAGASGDDGVYGEIMIENIGWEWNLDENNAGAWDSDNEAATLDADISATIHFNNLYLGLGDPGFDFNYADIPEGDYAIDANADAFDNGGGFSLGFKNDMIDIALLVASEKDAYMDTASDGESATVNDVDEAALWTNQDDGYDQDLYTPNADGDMIFGVTATVMPADGITVEATGFYDAESGTATDDLMAFGLSADVAMGAFSLLFPMDYIGYGDMTAMEIRPELGYTVMEGFDVNATVLYGTYEGLAPVNAVMDVTLGLADVEAFVPGLSWTLDVTASNLMDYSDTGSDSLPVAIDATASFMNGGMKPYVETGYDLGVAEMYLSIGVVLDSDFTGIDNTVITLDYTNDKLVDGEGYTEPVVDPSDDTEKGRVTLDFTVSF